jgi:DNA polymerase-3 subunit delta'
MSNALPPWIHAQTRTLLKQRGHAWLLSGPSGLGQYTLALSLVRAWLCERPIEEGACGQCGSCHAIDVHTHADLCVLMPETWMLALGWPLSEKAQSDLDEKKRKPSKEIRIEAMRDAVEFSQRTSARGQGKAVLVFPAEDMNAFTANALLKTLEEPAGDMRFVLASEAAHQLLPTIRSRCLTHTMVWPPVQAAQDWLLSQGLEAEHAEMALRACGGRPEPALQWAQSGQEPSVWASIPKAMARGDLQAVRDWSPQQVIVAQQQLCHDLMAIAVGAQPRFFQAKDLALGVALPDLSQWSAALVAHCRTMDHPFSAPLFVEALMAEAQGTLSKRLNTP